MLLLVEVDEEASMGCLSLEFGFGALSRELCSPLRVEVEPEVLLLPVELLVEAELLELEIEVLLLVEVEAEVLLLLEELL